VTEHFGVSASVGVAAAYAGTEYAATESFNVPLVGTAVSITDTSEKNKFLSGYYADFNLDWSANDIMGLYGGVSAQKLSAYTQTLVDRSARIDLGNAIGLRGGVNIKF
jgi:hypothetical protein